MEFRQSFTDIKEPFEPATQDDDGFVNTGPYRADLSDAGVHGFVEMTGVYNAAPAYKRVVVSVYIEEDPASPDEEFVEELKEARSLEHIDWTDLQNVRREINDYVDSQLPDSTPEDSYSNEGFHDEGYKFKRVWFLNR